MALGPTLLVLTPSTGGYYFGALLSGMAREVTAARGRVVVVQTLEPGVRSDALGEAPDFTTPVDWAGVDGVVSITSAAPAAYLAQLREAGMPVVVVSNDLGLEVPIARPDNHGGATAAVEHLIAHGHTRIGFVGNLVQQDLKDRLDAYRATMEAHGLPVDPSHVLHAGDNSELGGEEAARAFLALTHRDDRPTALMVATDRNAIGLMTTLQAAGVQVPHDVALAGFDDIEQAPWTTPGLTTVSQPFDQLGALAARLVLADVAGEHVAPTSHTYPAELVLRGSCGCSPDDHPVAPDGMPERLSSKLRRVLLTGEPAHDARVERRLTAVLADVDRLASERWVSAAEVEALAIDLHGLAPHPEELVQVARTLVEDLSTRSAAARSRIGEALRDLQSAAFLARAEEMERRLEEQFGVDAGLLDTVGADPCDLGWLAGTHVVAAVLALWKDEPDTGPLRIAGVHGTAAVPLEGLVGSTTHAEHFPPRVLVEAADPARRQVCFVVPVRTRTHAWGLLALVAEIDTMSARETYHHWGGLLATALEQTALQEAVHASEERYALAARAANDGLWELDLATEATYLSGRCRDLLGLDPEDEAPAEGWLGLVHPEDYGQVHDMLSTAMSLRGTPVEVECRLRRKDGEYRWVHSRCLGDGPDHLPVQRLVGSLTDIHGRKELEEQLRQGALFDTVTGLPNRRLFLDRLAVAVASSGRRHGVGFAVIFLDLDGFKLINDSLGHLAGDDLLRTVAERLRTGLRAVDTAARFGGDEFAVLLSDPVADEVLVIARRIQESIAQPLVVGGQEVAVSASVGITTSDAGYESAEDVLRDADTAMYHAKGTERGTASVFDPEMHSRASGRLRMRGELRTALADQQFVVHYQPIVSLDGAGVSHLEALVRWEHPYRGLLLPGAFLPDMEDNASMVALGRWLVDEVCRQVAVWRAGHDGPVAVSVNVSHREFWAPDLVETVSDALERHGVPPECLVLEITETVVMSDPTAALSVMGELHDLGVRLHIDDFGTGHSSLNALRTFPVDALKIDGSFIRELTVADRTTDLVEIILHMGRTLGLEVIAECVETPEQAEHLQRLGCDNAQGWLYARALPGEEAGALLGRALQTTAAVAAG